MSAQPTPQSTTNEPVVTTDPVIETPKPERPAYLPENFWDAENGEIKGDDFAKHIQELADFKAKADERASSIPESADKYKLELGEDIKLPAGVSINEQDPLYLAARELAAQEGWTQSEFNNRVGMFVKNQIADSEAKAKEIAEFKKTELTKLGAQGRERVEGVESALKAKFEDDAKHLIPLLVSAKQVELMERLLSGDGVSFNQNGRENGSDNGLPANWDNMSAIDRRTYFITKQAQ